MNTYVRIEGVKVKKYGGDDEERAARWLDQNPKGSRSQAHGIEC